MKARWIALVVAAASVAGAQTWELRGVLTDHGGTRYFLVNADTQAGGWFTVGKPPPGTILEPGRDADTVWVQSASMGRSLMRLNSGRVHCPRVGGAIGGVLINPTQADLDEQRAAIAARVQAARDRYAVRLALEAAARQ